MKRLLFTLLILSATLSGAWAQCQAIYYAYTNPNSYEVEFIDSTWGTTPNALSVWDFGDGTIDSSFGLQAYRHTYNAPGYYEVCLTVSYGGLSCGTYCDTVTVGNPSGNNCGAAFQYNWGIVNPYQLFFTNYSYGGSALNYAWSFGDGGTSALAEPDHLYTNNGTYSVCLTISDGNGCSDTFCDVVVINGGGSSNCSATWIAFNNGQNDYTFIDSSIVSTTGNHYSSWFIDGVLVDSTDYFTMALTPGSHYVCLTISDGANCTDTFCDSLFVGGSSAGCSTTFSYNATATGLTQFIANTSGTNPAFGIDHNWDFGDGNTSTDASPVHTFAQSGYYSVCLTITDSVCTASFCDSIYVPALPTTFDISGSVLTSNSFADAAVVYLIVEDSLSLYMIDSISTQQGSYHFYGVSQGNYLIKAALLPSSTNYSNYLPTYYGNELLWSNAASVYVNQTLTGQNIDLIAGSNPGGPGFVGGLISQGANKRGEGDPEVGVQIMLLDMNDNPVQYTFSNAQGEWEFSNIAYGTYQVYAEIPGKTTEPVTVTLSQANETVDNIGLTVETLRVIGTVTGIEEILMSTSSLYPNPTSGGATMTISTDRSANAELVILNAMGQEVMREELMLNVGQQDLNFNISSSPMGIYFMQLRIEGSPVLNEKILKQ